jgi:hypothetical protein
VDHRSRSDADEVDLGLPQGPDVRPQVPLHYLVHKHHHRHHLVHEHHCRTVVHRLHRRSHLLL